MASASPLWSLFLNPVISSFKLAKNLLLLMDTLMREKRYTVHPTLSKVLF